MYYVCPEPVVSPAQTGHWLSAVQLENIWLQLAYACNIKQIKLNNSCMFNAHPAFTQPA